MCSFSRGCRSAIFARAGMCPPARSPTGNCAFWQAAQNQSSEPYPYKNIHGYLRQIFEAFGPERAFWGTDITRMPCSYRQCVTMFTEELPWLKGRDLERVMGGAVVDWLGWKRPSAA